MDYLSAAFLIALCDFTVKSVIVELPAQFFPKKIFKNRVVIDRVYNKGVAAGKMEENPQLVKKLTTALLTVTFLADLPCLLSAKGSKIQKLGRSMKLGGALSNVIDRYLRGHVVDYIRFAVKNPKGRAKYLAGLTFNIGDVFILLGSALTLLGEAGSPKKRKRT